MSDKQKFEAFKQRAVAHNEEVYGAEIRSKYGDKEVDEANAAVMNLTREQYIRSGWTWAGRSRSDWRLPSGQGCPRKVRRARKLPSSTAGGSLSPGTGTTRSNTRKSPSFI